MGSERMAVTGNSAWDENKEQMVGRSRGFRERMLEVVAVKLEVFRTDRNSCVA